ncbi:hypothetical protein N9E51_00480 [Alphaproteobacteria bacterium]|nr:hypothetical protein [Alphaproteobacteria bacterium]
MYIKNIYLLISIFILLPSISFGETLNLKCSYFYFKLENKLSNAVSVRLGDIGEYEKPFFFMEDVNHFDIYMKEIYNPNKCKTVMSTRYNIDRVTGIMTKYIESFKPEKGKPKESYLKELKSKYPDIALGLAERNCKPKIGITNVRIFSDIGISSEQSWDWLQNDKAKYERERKKLNKANCEVLEKKF